MAKKKTATLEKDRAHQVYRLEDGTPVPGVTTALSVIAKPALIHWAWKMGTEGKDYRKVSGTAADIGTITHFLCECHVKGTKPDVSQYPSGDVAKAVECFEHFKAWWKANDYHLIRSEAQLVSKKFKFGGTLDLVVGHKGKAVLIDLKTSKAIYDEYWWQVGAYGLLWDEAYSDHLIERHIIVRIGKEDTSFEVQERGELSQERKVFLAALELYKLTKKGRE